MYGGGRGGGGGGGGGRNKTKETIKRFWIIREKRRKELENLRKLLGKNWFSDRVVDDWNRPSNQVVNAESLGSFKRRLDSFMDEDDKCKYE